MKVVIDRFEGEFAVAELPDGSTVNIPVKVLDDAHEGDVVNIEADAAETEKRRNAAADRLKRLYRR
ncbi:MAG: DUF3006 domain-containing protein [Clostridiales bacterium]|jgi:hypothetical protein|nr:DUF3006 domain-containing protein [Clostridiales bacterium]